jgi:Fe2+ transport system protein FeoA
VLLFPSPLGVFLMIRPATSMSFPVEYLPREEEGVIVEIVGEEPSVHRLEEMGVCCGCRIRMVSPGETCLVAIDGKRMCLRLREVAEILVAPVA